MQLRPQVKDRSPGILQQPFLFPAPTNSQISKAAFKSCFTPKEDKTNYIPIPGPTVPWQNIGARSQAGFGARLRLHCSNTRAWILEQDLLAFVDATKSNKHLTPKRVNKKHSVDELVMHRVNQQTLPASSTTSSPCLIAPASANRV